MDERVGTKLDWIAAEHWNTDNPHVHILIRGKADDGRDLVISSDYSIHGLRARAQELVTLELGPKSEERSAPRSNRMSPPRAGPGSTASSHGKLMRSALSTCGYPRPIGPTRNCAG